MAIFIAGVVIVLYQATRRCIATLRGKKIPVEAAGPPVLASGGAADGLLLTRLDATFLER